MNDNNNRHPSYKPPTWLLSVCAAAIIIGIIAFLIGLSAGPKLDAWLWLIIGFVYFGGIANGVLAWAAVFRVAQTRWSPAINRLGHSLILFLPVLFVALIILLCGVRNYVPWIAHPIPAKSAWLNVPFMIIRNIVLLSTLWILYYLLVRWSLAADAKANRGEAITPTDQYKLTAVGIAAVLTYTIASTIVSYDFIMSLSPEWLSTMFAPYYFCTNIYVGMAVLILMAYLLRVPLGVERFVKEQHFQDMGNLMLGFCLFTMGLFFAQYLTIWYGNLHFETRFLILRYYRGSWPILGWTAFIIGYAIPFILLQSRNLKRNPRLLTPVAVLAIIGVALERYVLVVPSLKPQSLLLSPISGLSLLIFLGAFILAIVLFFARYSPVSAAQEALSEVEKLEVMQ